jgi:hypothetical protein
MRDDQKNVCDGYEARNALEALSKEATQYTSMRNAHLSFLAQHL